MSRFIIRKSLWMVFHCSVFVLTAMWVGQSVRSPLILYKWLLSGDIATADVYLADPTHKLEFLVNNDAAVFTDMQVMGDFLLLRHDELIGDGMSYPRSRYMYVLHNLSSRRYNYINFLNQVNIYEPSFSPDLTYVAYSQDRETIILNLATSENVPVPENGYKFAWASDSCQLAYNASRGDYATINIYNVCDGTVRELSPQYVTNLYTTLSWSHSGDYIAYMEQDETSEYTVHVRIVDVHTGEEILSDNMLSSGNASLVSWSPVADQLLFSATTSNNSLQDIYLVDADERTLTQITDSSLSESNPTWSPDGTRIVFSLSQTSRIPVDDLFIMNIDTSNLFQITHHRVGFPIQIIYLP